MARGLAVLRIGRDGRVISSSEEATKLLGPAAGRICHRVVGGESTEGDAICREGCVHELLEDADERTTVRHGVVHDHRCAIQCERVGDEVVVVLQPAEALSSRAKHLTPRERQTLSLVAEGLTRAEIAERLGLQQSTVRTHLEHARARFEAHTLAEAVARWMAEDPAAGPSSM